MFCFVLVPNRSPVAVQSRLVLMVIQVTRSSIKACAFTACERACVAASRHATPCCSLIGRALRHRGRGTRRHFLVSRPARSAPLIHPRDLLSALRSPRAVYDLRAAAQSAPQSSRSSPRHESAGGVRPGRTRSREGDSVRQNRRGKGGRGGEEEEGGGCARVHVTSTANNIKLINKNLHTSAFTNTPKHRERNTYYPFTHFGAP